MLRGPGIEAPDVEARRILEATTGRSYAELFTDGTIDSGAYERALDLARRRASGEPLQYVVGVAGFRHLDLAVGPGVLVPRPETEQVAERAMYRLRFGGTVVDVGTGSGAIALAIADERPDVRVLATEIDARARPWAERNIARLGARVELIACDLLEGVTADLKGSLDVIVANPPYVAESERGMLPADVLEHEPARALFSGDDGLDVVRGLAADARAWLGPRGWLVTEIGERQGDAARALFEEAGYAGVQVLPDLAGRDRIVEGRNA